MCDMGYYQRYLGNGVEMMLGFLFYFALMRCCSRILRKGSSLRIWFGKCC